MTFNPNSLNKFREFISFVRSGPFSSTQLCIPIPFKVHWRVYLQISLFFLSMSPNPSLHCNCFWIMDGKGTLQTIFSPSMETITTYNNPSYSLFSFIVIVLFHGSVLPLGAFWKLTTMHFYYFDVFVLILRFSSGFFLCFLLVLWNSSFLDPDSSVEQFVERMKEYCIVFFYCLV